MQLGFWATPTTQSKWDFLLSFNGQIGRHGAPHTVVMRVFARIFILGDTENNVKTRQTAENKQILDLTEKVNLRGKTRQNV